MGPNLSAMGSRGMGYPIPVPRSAYVTQQMGLDFFRQLLFKHGAWWLAEYRCLPKPGTPLVKIQKFLLQPGGLSVVFHKRIDNFILVKSAT